MSLHSVSCSCVNLHNQQHVLVMCAVAFYMMENYPLDVGAEFMAGIIQVNESFYFILKESIYAYL